MKREEMAKRLEAVMRAADAFVEIADVPAHLRNNEVYRDRRAELNTVASLSLGQLLPDEEEELRYQALAQAAQRTLELLDGIKWDQGVVEGVTKRGQLRDALSQLNALVGVALGKDET